ncbi:MerR family DNA-binding transcriptional regulator [Kosakonia sp. S42]|nr:MerR family DNA-binding transcriptional regulator [Kosakonia sp. S42]
MRPINQQGAGQFHSFLRYHEEAGLLHPERTATGHRRYQIEGVATVERILPGAAVQKVGD